MSCSLLDFVATVMPMVVPHLSSIRKIRRQQETVIAACRAKTVDDPILISQPGRDEADSCFWKLRFKW